MEYNIPLFPKSVAGLSLADGSTWGITAGSEKALSSVSRLAEVMQLRPHLAPVCRLLVVTVEDDLSSRPVDAKTGPQVLVPWTLLPSEDERAFTYVVSQSQSNDFLFAQLVQLALVIARQVQSKGGILLHGALIERDSWGVILAGPGRVGKTTASRRLPSPWRSLSDDAALVVRGGDGAYWAHPWPTWSNFMSGGPGGTWDVEHAVPLKAIFFLQQAQQDHVSPVATGQSVCLLVELAEHTSWSMSHTQGKDVTRTLRLQRFENICTLVKMLPCYYLHLSLEGFFWEEIERVINVQNKGTL